MDLVRPDDEIEHGKILQKLVAVVLRHASDAADDQPGLAGLDFLHEADLPDRLPLRLVTDGAGIEHDEIGVLLRIGGDGAVGFQKAGERFGIAFVHLAAICFYMEFHGHDINWHDRKHGGAAENRHRGMYGS